MADEQKEPDTTGSDGFPAQNQQNEESSLGNDGGENTETSPGSYRSREDESEMEATAGSEGNPSGSSPPPTFVRLAPIMTPSEALGTGGSSSTQQMAPEGIESSAMDQSVSFEQPAITQSEGTSGSGLTDYKFVDGRYVQYTPTGQEGDGSAQLMDFNGKSSSVASIDGGQGYICKVCGAWYKLRQSLNSHIQDQHQGKRFKCCKCAYSTNRRHDLYRHDGQVHKGTAKQAVPLVPMKPKSIAPKSTTVAAALKKRDEKKATKKPTSSGSASSATTSLNLAGLSTANMTSTNMSSVNLSSPTSFSSENKSIKQLLNPGEGGNAQQLVVVSDGMQGAVYSGSSSPQQDQIRSGWLEESSSTGSSSKPHRQTESFEHQLPSGAIFRRITEITFFPDGRIRETRTEEYEMP